MWPCVQKSLSHHPRFVHFTLNHYNSKAVAAAARPIFEQIQPNLLPGYENYFVSIEPESRDFFLGATLTEAIEKARLRYPDQLVHAFRLGHAATIHFGMQTR